MDEETLKLDLAAIERPSERDLTLLTERLAVEEQQREVDRLAQRLKDEHVIRASQAGRIIEVKVNAGDVISVGTPLATLAPVGEEDLVGVLYVPPGAGKRITIGMPAKVILAAVEREAYGHLVGTVEAVAPQPATTEGMRRTLQNDRLVAQLSATGAPIEVRILLQRGESGDRFVWSVSDGPEGGVSAGTLVAGEIVVDEVPILDLIVPGATARLERL